MMFAGNSGIAMKSVLMMGVAAVGMMMAAGGARAQSNGYTYTEINVPGASPTVAMGISGAGQIVWGWTATAASSTPTAPTPH